jgi:hypothetical protein
MKTYNLLVVYVCSGTQISFCCHSTTVKYINQKLDSSWVLVAHAYTLSYSGGRDQEVRSSKPSGVDSF